MSEEGACKPARQRLAQKITVLPQGSCDDPRTDPAVALADQAAQLLSLTGPHAPCPSMQAACASVDHRKIQARHIADGQLATHTI
jgi:hypothetical protein